ncbi:hypothetical protein LTR12_000428 [Friedmanniomyces endolithicus]|nr:hypothetical protein LTR74_011831 [Friedmanniomyces endolithicus]KAK1825139.1 hypothetical protein LTR12_000428 [Friedmanniomyces endolithicus]
MANMAKRKQADEDDEEQPRTKNRRSNRLAQVQLVNYYGTVDPTDARTTGDEDETRENDESGDFETPVDEAPALATRIAGA